MVHKDCLVNSKQKLWHHLDGGVSLCSSDLSQDHPGNLAGQILPVGLEGRSLFFRVY